MILEIRIKQYCSWQSFIFGTACIVKITSLIVSRSILDWKNLMPSRSLKSTTKFSMSAIRARKLYKNSSKISLPGSCLLGTARVPTFFSHYLGLMLVINLKITFKTIMTKMMIAPVLKKKRFLVTYLLVRRLSLRRLLCLWKVALRKAILHLT